MMIQRWSVSNALAASVVVLLGASAARADVTWVIQPSQSTYTFLPQLGTVVVDANNNAIKDANGNYTFKELYNAVQQNSTNSPGTSFNPGFTNSQVTSESGTFTTVGNTFLSVLNFGPRPGTVPPPSPLVTFANNGTWVPNGPTGGPFPAPTALRLRPMLGLR